LPQWGSRMPPGDRIRCWSSTTTRSWPPSLPRRATGAKVRDRDQGRDQGQASVATGASRHRGDGPGAGAQGGAHHGATSVLATGGKGTGSTRRQAAAGYATRAADLATMPRIVGCHVALVREEEVFWSHFPTSVILSFIYNFSTFSYLDIQFLQVTII
jgi:hypothetical protein